MSAPEKPMEIIPCGGGVNHRVSRSVNEPLRAGGRPRLRFNEG